tara:strand:+ start:382 stop:1863 length:1482 start_codon:yes stop_codon:yes gene_type:complete
MNESNDQKNTDTSVQPEEKTLYQQKLEKERSNSISIQKGAGILVGLTLLLVIVIFILPLLVQEDREDLPNQVIEEKTIFIPNQETLAQKPIAEALLSELLIKIESLKLQGILFWGMEKWEDVLIVQQEGDSAFIEQQYDLSAGRYREALQMLSDLEISIPDVLTNALKMGQSSILSGNENDAIANFEIALAIDGNNIEAKLGLDRALKLDQVLERTQRGQTEFAMGSYEPAIQSFEDALLIDPDWEPAINGLAQSKQSYADNLFQESLSKGYRSLNDESFDEAESLFDQALSIRPNSEEALQALDELNLKRIASLTKSLKYKGLIAEVNEEWNQAKGFYQEILVIDANLEEVKESLSRVESRILLEAEMKSIIARSDAYNDNKVLGQAQALLETAKSIERIGPKMEESIQKLDSLIQIALIPIEVIFESDQFTEVTIFKVDQMGTFQQKIVSLRPGIYTARGSRKGFKDETIRFRVDPNKQNQRVKIICNKKI